MAEMARQQNNIIQTIRSYGSQLFGFIRSRVNSNEDAEDILQDVWYQLSNQPAIEEIESMSGWLYRVAKNKISDRFRRRKTELLDDSVLTGEENDFHLAGILLAETDDPETKNFQQLFWEALFAALDELPLNQREVFILNELEDMTLQQIANLRGEKLKTIISRKRYAVQRLRNRLEELYNEFMNY
jgi:RNA polymerase sigma factor (sigma-70 family)